MPVELIVPTVGESITEVEIGDWLKREGEAVDQDEPVVVIETDKVTVELPAPASGTITTMLKHKGEKASVGDVIGYMEAAGMVYDSPRSRESGSADGQEPSRKPAEDLSRKSAREEQIIPMTPIRRRIAER